MIINSLEKMEEIVSNNKLLSWDGWSVVESQKSEKARTSKYGMYKDGSWYIVKRFGLDRSGWNIPDRLVKKNG